MQVFVWVAVGGQGTLAGPFFAAIGIKLLESWLSGLSAWTYLLILGIVFIMVVVFFPSGVAGALQRWHMNKMRHMSPSEANSGTIMDETG
jgi:ABC-type branched-subunit amino acid transport system permease subunit